MADHDVVMVGVNKTFPGGARAVVDFDTEIAHGDFVALLGPSGCGKTTTLRMIGGLEEVTSGKIYLRVAGASVDAGAPNGDPGEWLLDPLNVTIVDDENGALTGGVFTATGGDTADPDDGFAVTNAAGVALWAFYQTLDLQKAGYPISQRWVDGVFTYQAFQKIILQWDSDKSRFNYLNTLDILHNRHGVNLPNVPAHQNLAADAGAPPAPRTGRVGTRQTRDGRAGRGRRRGSGGQ